MEQKKKKEMAARIIAGAFLLVPVLFLIIKAPADVFFCAMLLVSLLAVHEFIKIAGKKNAFVPVPLMWAGAVSIPCAIYFGGWTAFTLTFFLFMFVLFVLKMFSSNPTENVIEDVSYSLFSIMFVPFLLTFLSLLKAADYKWVIFLCFVIWASDTFAYFTGSAIGRHKLIPKVSPGKSVEGLIGGVIGALITAALLNYYLIGENWAIIAIMAIDVIAAGVIGDLIESMIKRSAEVKDSGSLIPGHGGVLDRLDSLMIGAPVLYFYVEYLAGR